MVVTIFFALLSYVLANLFVDRIFDRMVLANIPVAALSFALLAGFYWKRASRTGAWVSIIVGLLVGFCCYFYWGEEGGYTWYWAIIGLPLIFGSGAIASYLKPDLSPSYFPVS